MARKSGSRAAARDPIAALRRRVSTKLSGFTAEFPAGLDGWNMSSRRLERSEFAVPELLLFTLRNVMGWRWTGHGEKERWAVLGSVAGNPVGFALRKFGLHLLRGEPDNVDDKRIVGQLHAALKIVEAFLEPYAHAQVEVGELLVVNHFAEFVNRYGFFRQKAEAAFKRAKRLPRRRKSSDPDKVITSWADDLNHAWASTRDGFFLSTAMVDSYFSSLEHRLILLKAFKGAPLVPGEFRAFLSLRWDEKLTDILVVSGNRRAELALGKLRNIKERIRNPFAHGGVENDNGSLFIHIPHIGAVPANFSRHGRSARFSLFPIEAEGHAEACAVFDEVDALLSTEALSGPHRLVDAGVDPSFDQDSIARYAAAIAGGDAQIEAFIRSWGAEWDRHANMDY